MLPLNPVMAAVSIVVGPSGHQPSAHKPFDPAINQSIGLLTIAQASKRLGQTLAFADKQPKMTDDGQGAGRAPFWAAAVCSVVCSH